MAWPAGGIATTDLDGGSDSPGLARPAILAAVQAVNDIAAARGAADGVASLDSGGQVPSAQIPAGIIPAGVLVPYAGSAAPTGWLLCDGSAVSRTTYATLFAALATTYGVGDGSTTFNLPDMRGRIAAGKDDMGGTPAGRLNVTLTGTRASTSSGVITGLSSTAGLSVGMKASGTGIGAAAVINSIDSSTQVTLSVNSTSTGSGSIRFGVVDGATLGDTGGAHVHTLATTQIPAHNHNFDSGGDAHYILRTTGGALGLTSGGVQANSATAVQNAGGGQAHANVQPTMILNHIIKT